MKKLLLAAAISVAAAIAPAHADYYVKDGNGVLKLFKAGTLAGSVVLPYNAMSDANGLPFGTTTNPIAMRFGTGVFLPDFVNPQHVICDSGCSGGGGGSSYTVTYGATIGTLGTPTGFKDASGNFQSLLGDVTNGQWVNIKASVPISLTGTLPAFASTPTVNIGTAPTITVNGSVSLTGTLPAFAATPTFNLGTLNGAATAANQTAVQGTVAGGTAATASQLAGAVYNLSPLTLTNGQGAALQADANGYLRVNVMTGGGGSAPFGATFPASGVALGMSQGGNLVGVTGTGGNLNVQCANCSGSGVSTVDKAAFVASTSIFAGAGGFYQTTPTANPLTTGQQGMFQVTAQRALFSNLRDATGAEIGVAGAPLQVSLANTAANGTALLVTGTGGTFPVTGTFWQATQPVSIAATVAVSGPLTDTQLRATAVPVSISGNQGVNVAQINGVTPLMGNGPTGTGSQRVTIASDNTAFSVNAIQSGTWNIGSITTLPALVTGSAIIGRVGIDQTTPGTTNLVSIGTTGTVNPTTAANWGINTLGSTTSGQSGQLALGAVTTAAPTYTTAQSNALSLTTGGALRVEGLAGFNLSQINGVALLAGNGPTGTGSPRVTIANDQTAFSVNAAATLAAETTKVIGTVRNLGNAGAITDFAGQNAASPANAWLMGCQFNTTPTTITTGNASPCQLDNAGNLKVNIVAGASSGAVAQGSTTSGQTGGLMQAAVTTAAPTYTTAQTNPLSLTTTGNLRVSDSTAQATLSSILTAAQGANPVNLNTVVTAQTGLTPGASSSSQTGTVVASNTDLSSVAGVAIGVPVAFGSSPGAVRVQGVNAAVIPTSTPSTQNSSVASNHVLKGSAGALMNVTASIGATSGWLMIFDATSAPADGAVTPKYCRYVKSDGTGGATSVSWGNLPMTFSTGITAVFSSTGCYTKTASATAFFSAQVQ